MTTPKYPDCYNKKKPFKISSDHTSQKERLKQLDAAIAKHENKPAIDLGDDDTGIIYNEISFLFDSFHKLIEIITEQEK